MTRRRSIAALLLMLALCFAPSAALAALACATHCCPAQAAMPSMTPASPASSAADASSSSVSPSQTAGGAALPLALGRANCCLSQRTPVADVAPASSSLPPIATVSAPLPLARSGERTASNRVLREEARLAGRTSPLRLSVVLLI